jgi:hypothetical protein
MSIGADSHGLGRRFDGIVIEDAPTRVLTESVASFSARYAATGSPTRVPALIDRIRAALSFDDWAAGPALALRSTAVPGDGSRHLVYTVGLTDSGAPATEVAISLYPSAQGAVSLVGQVLDASIDGAVHLVEAMRGDVVLAATTTSESGEFSLELPADWTEIVLVDSDAEITVPAAPIQDRPTG